MDEIAEDWCCLLRQQRLGDGTILDLEDVAGRLGLETSCALVLGRRLGFLLPGGESELARKLADAIHKNFIAIRQGFLFFHIIQYTKRKLVFLLIYRVNINDFFL